MFAKLHLNYLIIIKDVTFPFFRLHCTVSLETETHFILIQVLQQWEVSTQSDSEMLHTLPTD